MPLKGTRRLLKKKLYMLRSSEKYVFWRVSGNFKKKKLEKSTLAKLQATYAT